MLGFGFLGGDRETVPEFTSRMSLPPKHAVVMLGAGASAGAGCPLMRGFIDRARDFLDQGLFSPSERGDVQITLDLYRDLRAQFSISEEDIENIEDLLSLVDLASLISRPPIDSLSRSGLADHVRRFIDAVVAKSARVPGPHSPAWCGSASAGPLVLKALTRALAYLGNNVTVLTTNYDCLVEYACYCMGLPFTYNRSLGEGVEVLKLHGSHNWVRCSHVGCPAHANPQVSPIEHHAHDAGSDVGYLGRVKTLCEACGSQLTPVIVPPTWAKHVDNEALRETWSRAVCVLGQAEAFVAIGYSLPLADAHLRHLLHLGFSSGVLRQALAVVGDDQGSADRWSDIFRQSWRNNRFEARQASFSKAFAPAIRPALVVPYGFEDKTKDRINATLLPISPAFQRTPDLRNRLRLAMEQHGLDPNRSDGLGGVDWAEVVAGMRSGGAPKGQSTVTYRQIVVESGLDWRPDGPIEPTHGGALRVGQADGGQSGGTS